MNSITITCKHDTVTERNAAKRLEKLLGAYDISRFYFTYSVLIEDRAIPHDLPALTLNSFPYSDENIVLETFLHEQLHWYLESGDERVKWSVAQAVNELRVKYPHAPWGYPLGCKDLDSTYLHLILCYLSNKTMQDVVGLEPAARVLYYLQNHHYLMVFRTVERDNEYLAALVDKYKLHVTG